MDLAAVMDEIGDRLDTITGLRVYRFPPDHVSPPAAVVTYPEAYLFDETFGRGMDRITLPVVVMVGKVSDRASRDRIGAYADGAGPKSIKAVLEADSEPSYLSLPGTSGSYASTPDRPSLDITGDLDLRFEITPADETPSASQTPLSKYTTTGNQRSWKPTILTTGALQLGWTTNGSTVLFAATGAGAVRAGRYAYRIFADVANGTNRVFTFYDAPRIAGPWAPIGSPVVQAGVTSFFSSSAPLTVSGVTLGTLEMFAGRVHAIEVRNGEDGPSVAAASFDQKAGAVGFVDDVGLAWSLHDSAAIVAGAPSSYTSFDSCRVSQAEFDIVQVAGVEHLAATFSVDIAGAGATP